jgi:hypothetical protein
MGAPFDLYDQAVLTDLIYRPLTTRWEDNPRLGDLLAPVKSIQSRVAKIRTAQTKAFGVGQFKAPGATPRLYKADQTWQETVMELVLLEEMERIDDETWLRLNSTDEVVRRAAGVDLVTRGRILALRNERLTEKMRWEAFLNGTLTVSYEQGQTDLFIDYGYPAGHKPTAGTSWATISTADPVADLRLWSNVLAASSGYFGTHIHMSSNTYDYIVRNAKVRAFLTATNRSMLIPTKQDILTLLREGSDIIIYDNGYRADTVGTARGIPDSLTRFLPDGKVLMTTDYQMEGVNIAETLDGQVLVNNGYNSVAIMQGTQSEVMVDQLSKNHFFRQASARVPRIIYPECFLSATVVF